MEPRQEYRLETVPDGSLWIQSYLIIGDAIIKGTRVEAEEVEDEP
jgi:hypothetical protein